MNSKSITSSCNPIFFGRPRVVFTFGLPTIGGDLKELEDAMDAEIKKVQEELISDKEFEKSEIKRKMTSFLATAEWQV